MTRRGLLRGLALAPAVCFAQNDAPATAQPPAPAQSPAFAQPPAFVQPPALVPPPDADPLRQLRAGHPRLILLDADFDRLRLMARENTLARRIYSDLEKECDRLLSIPPVEYKLAGTRLEPQTRRAIDRITSLALMYRLSGRDSWLRRAMLEMNAAAAFKDWNPGRLIDTAEMTHAFAIGYDWLFNALTPEERTTVREAIVTKALDQVIPVYQHPPAWARERAHWNLVCNGAFGMGALAVAEDAAEKSGAVLRGVLESAPRGMQSFSAEGGWQEGPAYGEYAMRYACLLFASLNTALGSDSGLSGSRGFDRAGRFRVYMTGPANRMFNFGGTPDDPGTAPELFWLARRFANPVLAWSEQKQIERSERTAEHAETSTPNALDLAWFERDTKAPQAPAWPLDSVFHSVQVASFRGSWDDPNAIFLAVKGGDNKTNRSHLDLGSFVLDAGGVRWALDPDLGDRPPVPGVAAQGPWATRTESHNTLLIDGGNQDPRAEAVITHQELGPDLSWVQIDLSRSNGGRVRQWIRRAGLLQRQAALVQDVLRSAQPVEVVWGMITDSDVTVNGPVATLRKGAWNLGLEIRTPRHAVFDTVPAGGPLRKLIVRLGDKTTDLDLSVLMTPWRDGQPKPKITGQFPEFMASASGASGPLSGTGPGRQTIPSPAR